MRKIEFRGKSVEMEAKLNWKDRHPALPFYIVAYTGGYRIHKMANGYGLFIERTRTLVATIATIEECKALAEKDREAEEIARIYEQEYDNA